MHGPVRGDNCSACHSIHGGDQEHLLQARFPAAQHAPFDPDAYALCFQCHEGDLVLVERTRTLTEFRDGDQNLHYLHVQGERKGRTCRACHVIHGGDQPRNMAEAVVLGDSEWLLPIGFELEDGGGSCAPGCHEAMSYRREKDAPDAEAPAQEDPP